MPPHQRVRQVILCALLLGLTEGAVGLATAQHPPAATGAGPAVPVTAVKPLRQDVPVFLHGLGLVVASKTVVLRPRVDGTIDRVTFTEGDEVKAGTVLALIDPRPYQATLDQAIAKRASDEANLGNARLNLNRSVQLARNHFEAQQTVDTNTSNVAQMTAALKGDDATISAARLNLEFCRITAPFDGRVGLRLIDPGNFVRAADNTSPGIATLSQIRPISVTFTLPQDSIPSITAAIAHGKPPVIASSSDGKDRLAEGTLLTIDNAIDTTTGTIKVKAQFENADNRLWPGQFINVQLLIDRRMAALTVPSQAVQRGPGGLFVYVIKPDRTVAVRPIEVVQDTGTLSVISKGLADGETIVLDGQSRLSNGTRIALSGPDPSAPGVSKPPAPPAS